MKIDNFNHFKWNWLNEDEFYFIQIIKRKKDNPNVPGINGNNHMRCIKEYSIFSEKQLEKYKEEMINIAETTNSRIYIHPAKRSKDKVSKEMLKLITENIISGKNNLSGIYRSACGGKTYVEKLWIVDIDLKDINYIKELENFINQLKPEGDKIKMCLETLNGYHLITSPFNLQEFKLKHLEIDIHKNNPTLLYKN